MTLKTVIDTFRDSISSCSKCKSDLLIIEESVTRYSMFNVGSGIAVNDKETKPLIRYMFSCAICKNKIFSHTTQVKEWETYWDFLANMFNKQASIRQKAKERMK